ncbi:hypothetical protein BKP35_13210 [Anaerobacillus arseniciselenatis]|uniref:Uncharacterized protein n=1 Tax=Anaerobacillus arseniciselenatis TaxID=85682 RepID=A0A1S2LDQ1_9BACI|nr:hypothetical protein [Anaerobacillus arseniciselenatis]OIJ10642.1 hypothetical protein BKP35_13210 [Anaerobacillus arseniciselenatis]
MSNGSTVDTKTVLIPFSFTYSPIKKLALINIEKDPDQEYIGLEPQVFERSEYGTAYRVIAYRKDGYVDVYDDLNLQEDDDDCFDVTGKGLCERMKVQMKNVTFEKRKECFYLSFQFTDKFGREIVAKIFEHTKKRSRGVDLLAPVGSSSEHPTYLPLFFLYDFDFVRKYQTEVEVSIDGKAHTPDPFPYPIPKDFQWRYYTRFSEDCHLIEFANAKETTLQECHIDTNNIVVQDDLIQYTFDEDKNLTKISLINQKHHFLVQFKQGFPDIRKLTEKNKYKDTFTLNVDARMGFISGEYEVNIVGDEVEIQLIPTGGWITKPNSFFTKMMFKEKSIFCSWPKTYKYTQKIDLSTLQSVSKWERTKG